MFNTELVSTIYLVLFFATVIICFCCFVKLKINQHSLLKYLKEYDIYRYNSFKKYVLLPIDLIKYLFRIDSKIDVNEKLVLIKKENIFLGKFIIVTLCLFLFLMIISVVILILFAHYFF